MLSAINFKQIPLISVFKGCNVVSELACFLLINLSSQGQIDDMLFAGDNIYLNSFCLKKKNRFIYLFIYFCLHWGFLAVRGLSLVALHGLLIAVASPVAGAGSGCSGCSSCGVWALE